MILYSYEVTDQRLRNGDLQITASVYEHPGEAHPVGFITKIPGDLYRTYSFTISARAMQTETARGATTLNRFLAECREEACKGLFEAMASTHAQER